MNPDERARFDELVDAGVDPERVAELAEELGDPADAPRGCAIGCVAGVALLLILAAVVGVAALLLGGRW